MKPPATPAVFNARRSRPEMHPSPGLVSAPTEAPQPSGLAGLRLTDHAVGVLVRVQPRP